MWVALEALLPSNITMLILLTTTIICMFLFLQLKRSYPIELEREVKSFCDESIDNQRDFLWLFRFKKLDLNKQDGFYALLFATLSIIYYQNYSGLELVVLQVITFVLMLSSAIDLKINLIPESMHVMLIALGLLFSPMLLGIDIENLVYGMVAGYGLMYSAFWITSSLMGKEAMGMADIKYAAGIGAIIGIANIPVLILASSILGAISIPLMKNKNKQYPFGPFLSISAILLILNEIYFKFDFLSLI